MNTPATDPSPFIYAPKTRASTATRTLHGVLTLAAWALYAYLWLPVLTVLAWVMGVRTSYVELYVRNNRFDNSVFDILVALQTGLPAGVDANVLVAAADRNYVNWVRGGNFNPSGTVRVSSIRGDGAGLFGAIVSRRLTITTDSAVSARCF